MKIKMTLFVLMLVSMALNVFSQEYYLYVYALNEKLKPNLKVSGESNSVELNKIFKDFGVERYYQSFPGAKTPELLNYYEIHFNGDVDSLENLLKQKKLFEKVYRCDSYKPASCSNPVAINDYKIASGEINNYALDLLDAQCAWNITKGDPNIIVGVIDTEFEMTHEDMVNTFAGAVGTRTHSTDHGTMVSSCVATGTNNHIGIAGIGYNTRVRGYHVNGSTIWNGIWNAYLDGIKIINVSWTGIGTYPNILNIQEMINNGVVLIFAAGNDNNAAYHSLYANIPGVINVSGVDRNNNHGPTGVAHNDLVDVCALSGRVPVCSLGNTYTIYGGTSLSAPQVAGVVALMRSINPNLSPPEIENIIKTTAVPIADANQYPGQLGAGRVNAYNATKRAVCTLQNIATISSQTINTEITVNGSTVNIQNTNVAATGKLKVNTCNQVNIGNNFSVTNGATLNISVGP